MTHEKKLLIRFMHRKVNRTQTICEVPICEPKNLAKLSPDILPIYFQVKIDWKVFYILMSVPKLSLRSRFSIVRSNVGLVRSAKAQNCVPKLFHICKQTQFFGYKFLTQPASCRRNSKNSSTKMHNEPIVSQAFT